jgi:hypothetical protein
MTAAKSAETARFDANVGEVDIAIDHIGDNIADCFGAQMICSQYYSWEVGAVRLKQPSRFFGRNVRPCERAIEYASNDRVDY